MFFARLFAPAAIGLALIAAPLPSVAAPAVPGLSADEQAAVDDASAYLEGIGELKGRFVQIDAQGVASGGDFYLQRPGRIRFVYDPPSSLLVVADGRDVAQSDPRLKTFQKFPLGSTPLSLFLAKDVRFDRGVAITHVDLLGGAYVITARDADHPNQGQIVLTFATHPTRLQSWRLTDRQGRTTDVRLTQLQAVSGLDPSLFVIQDPRAP